MILMAFGIFMMVTGAYLFFSHLNELENAFWEDEKRRIVIKMILFFLISAVGAIFTIIGSSLPNL